MKILCVGDSLALPGHGNLYEETWFYLLKKRFPNHEFISFFRRASTTDILILEAGDGSDCLEIYSPDFIILQLGVVDCAPRLVMPRSVTYYFLKILPHKFKTQYLKLLKILKKRKQNSVYVKKEKFLENIVSYLERCKKVNVKKVFIIGISFADSRMEKKNKYFNENALLYNSIYENISKDIDFVEFINPLDSRKYSEMLFEDGYHPNKLGNKLVFSSLEILLQEYL